MEYEKIKQLMDDMGNSKLTSLDIEFPDGIKIKMEKNNQKQVIVNDSPYITKEINEVENLSEVSTSIKDEKEDKCITVKSPMIGTFYMKPSPDSKPYVEVGQTVKKGTVLCIIEAMKLMNEIESEYDGKIVEILVKDGETVDYGKPIFKLSEI